MKGPSEFEVYYIEKGNPMKGNRIEEGNINPIGSYESLNLTYVAKKSGNYKFRALQREGHGNKYDSRHELWSETITVECNQPSIEDEKPDKKDIKEVINETVQQEPNIKPEESKGKKETTPNTETIPPVTPPEKEPEKVPTQETVEKVEMKTENPEKQSVEIKQTKIEGNIEESQNTLNKDGG